MLHEGILFKQQKSKAHWNAQLLYLFKMYKQPFLWELTRWCLELLAFDLKYNCMQHRS